MALITASHNASILFLSQLLGEEELVVEQEWTGVLGFTLDG